MTMKTPWRLLWIVLGIAAVVAVMAVAYNWGVNHGHGGGPFFGPRRDFGFGMMGGTGFGWWGIIPGLIILFLVIWLFAMLLTGSDRSNRTGSGGQTPSLREPGDVERLRELSDLHERGRLTDEEFAAAKRKLLGL